MKLALPALLALVFLPACASVRTIQIAADDTIAGSSAQVDVVRDTPEIQNVSVRQYFTPGNPVRAAANPRTVRFGAGQPAVQQVSATGLGKRAIIIADLPGGHSDGPGDLDKRRKTIPLSGKLPGGQKVTSTLRANVSPGGIAVSPVK